MRRHRTSAPAASSSILDALYDLSAVGVQTYSAGALSAPRSPNAYLHDAARPGFAVGGHPFLADLGTDAAAVIEYLKPL